MQDPSPERIKKAVEAGEDAFWQAVADAFPEVKTGDLPPDATVRFLTAAEEAVRTWLYVNRWIEVLSKPSVIDDEELAALGEGRLTEPEQARLVEALCRDGAALAAFRDLFPARYEELYKVRFMLNAPEGYVRLHARQGLAEAMRLAREGQDQEGRAVCLVACGSLWHVYAKASP